MNSLQSQIGELEIGLTRISRRVSGFPITEVLTSQTLVHLGRDLAKMLAQRVRPYGLEEIEFRTLMVVYSFENGTANPSALCSYLGQSPANITRITDVLVERGLVSRVPNEQDRRGVVLQLTPHGERVVDSLLPVTMDAAGASYSDFSPVELQQLLSSLKRLAGTIDRLNAVAPQHSLSSK